MKTENATVSSPLRLMVAGVTMAAMLAVMSAVPALADVTARLNQEQVVLGDPVTLELRLEGDAAAEVPDLSPLEQDFDVLGTSQSMQTTIVNGNMTQSRSWLVQIAPREVGLLTVPEITVGSETSRPLPLEVLDPASVPRGDLASTGIQIDVEVPSGDFFVQQEIPVTVRILDGVGLRQARLTPLNIENASIRQVGEDQVSNASWQGRPVRVIERRYLVTPQASGPLQIPALTLRGVVPDASARNTSPFGRDPFADMRQRFGFPDMGGFGGSIFDDFMTPTREVTARAEAITLDISPRPDGVDGWFLPAQSVELRSAWQPEPPTFKVGEATTRLVQIVAVGASAEQVPELDFGDVPGARIYVDRSDVRDTQTPEGSAAIWQYTLSIVPTEAGEVTLPEIALQWFDTEAGETRTATLASETIQVAEGSAPIDTAPPPAATAAGTDPANAALPDGDSQGAAEPDVASDLSRWVDRWRRELLWGATALAGLVLAGLVWLGWRRSAARRMNAPVVTAATGAGKRGSTPAEAARSDRGPILEDLRAACRNGDVAKAYDRLMAWRNAGGAALLNQDRDGGAALAEAQSALEARLFGSGNDTATWNGDALYAAIRRIEENAGNTRKGASRTGALPPLYGSSSA